MPLIDKWMSRDFQRSYGPPAKHKPEAWDKFHTYKMNERYRAKWIKLLEEHPELSVYIRNCWMMAIGIELAADLDGRTVPRIEFLYEYCDDHLQYMIKHGCDADTLP
jgi:hypothetical protein